MFLALNVDFGPCILAEQNAVALLDLEGDHFSVIASFTTASCNYSTFLWFFLGGVGNDDPSGRCFIFIDALDQEPVLERADFHESFPLL